MADDKHLARNKRPLPNHIRLAAIDVGSNAIRMVVADYDGRNFLPIQKYRFPIRLGAEVFEKGAISQKTLKQCARIFAKFAEVAKSYSTEKIRAVGTSALREAKNQTAFIELMRRKSGISIEVVSGMKEAGLIFRAVQHQVGLRGHRSLLIDIGGGSVELTFVEAGRPTSSQSFPFGTVRTLETLKKRGLTEKDLGLVMGEYIIPLSEFIHRHRGTKTIDFAVGTGGNFESLGKLKAPLLGLNSRTELSAAELDQILAKLKTLSMKERVEKLGLRPDRADVVIPAGLVVQAALRQASIGRLLIPGVGLKDGILWSLVESKSASAGSTTSTRPTRARSPKNFLTRER